MWDFCADVLLLARHLPRTSQRDLLTHIKLLYVGVLIQKPSSTPTFKSTHLSFVTDYWRWKNPRLSLRLILSGWHTVTSIHTFCVSPLVPVPRVSSPLLWNKDLTEMQSFFFFLIIEKGPMTMNAFSVSCLHMPFFCFFQYSIQFPTFSEISSGVGVWFRHCFVSETQVSSLGVHPRKPYITTLQLQDYKHILSTFRIIIQKHRLTSGKVLCGINVK